MDLRIREHETRTVDFAKLINKVCFSIGISKALNPIELDLLFFFLKKEFPLVRYNMIEDAFDKFSAGKLTFKINGKEVDSIDHYDKFDNRFVARVLNSYSGWLRDERRKVKAVVPESHQIEIYENPEEQYNLVCNWYKNHGNFDLCIANWNSLYRMLSESKKIDLDIDEKVMFAENVKADVFDEYNLLRSQMRVSDSLKSLVNDIKTNGNKSKLWGNLCRKLMVQKYIETNCK